jgi:hypothetical protein
VGAGTASCRSPGGLPVTSLVKTSGCWLELARGGDTEEAQAELQGVAGELAQSDAVGDQVVRRGLEDRARLVELGERLGKGVQVGAEAVRLVVGPAGILSA